VIKHGPKSSREQSPLQRQIRSDDEGVKGKGKAVQLLDWSGPEGSRKLR